MTLKHLAAAAALSAVCAPGFAFDQLHEQAASTLFYISIPLDADLSRRDNEVAYGIRLQGRRDYQGVNLDSRMFTFLPLGGLEVKWIVAGVVAAGAAAAIGGSKSSTTASLQEQQTQNQAILAAQPQPEPCPQVCE